MMYWVIQCGRGGNRLERNKQIIPLNEQLQLGWSGRRSSEPVFISISVSQLLKDSHELEVSSDIDASKSCSS